MEVTQLFSRFGRVYAQSQLGRTTRLGALLGVLAVLMAVGSSSALAVAPPVVTIDAPSGVSYTTAHLTGSVDPQGSQTTYQFQYSTEPEFLGWTPAGESQSAGAGSGPAAVKADLAGLTPNTTYAVRLIAVNAEGTQESATQSPYPVLTTLEVAAPTVTIKAPSAVTGTTANFSGTVNPNAPGAAPQDPVFDATWQFQCTPECPGLTPATIPSDDTTHEVNADATGLVPGTTYEVSLVVANAAGQTSAGPEGFSTPTVAPQITNLNASPLITEATLGAQINPGAAETSYHFEYGTTTSYGQSTPDTTIPAGTTAVPVNANLSGLTPTGTYHYRLVASNSVETVENPDKTFTTHAIPNASDSCSNAAIRAQQDTTGLADCRAYELVNPPGVDVGDIVRVPVVSDDGNHAVYMSLVTPDGALGGALASSFVASRGEAGWVSADINATIPRGQSQQAYSIPAALSSDYTQAIINTTASLTDEDADSGSLDVYRVDVGTGRATWLSQGDPASNLTKIITGYLGASPDLKRTVFAADGPPLFAGFPGTEVYESDNSGLSLVSRLPDGTPAGEGRPADGGGIHGGRHGVSDDAQRLYFVDRYGGGNRYGLYEREGGVTVAVSASQRAGDNGAPIHPLDFIGATHDGSVAYFASNDQLTDAATDGGGFYRWVRATQSLEQITPAAGSPEGLEATTTISDDLSHIYFRSPRTLLPGAIAGATNLYVWTGGQVRFIAALPAGGDIPRVSRDGRYALITTTDSVGGASNNGHAAIYEYDAASGDVACVSCRPDGAPSEGEASLTLVPQTTLNPNLLSPRNITDDGRVFFMSSDRIVPADQSSTADVYEYDRGAVSLLTSGRGDYIFYLADNSDDGRDVFFLTQKSLLAEDRDAEELDLYDARAGGGFPAAPVDSTPPCRGDGCQDPPVPAPVFQDAASASFAGVGDLTASVVKKPAVRSLSRAQKLSKALKVCKKKSRKVRKKCESQARKRFGARKASSKSRGSK